MKIKVENGGLLASLLERLCRPLVSLDIIAFEHSSPYHDPLVLHEQYVTAGLSLRQIAAKFLSSPETVRQGLIAAGIPRREGHKPHGWPSQPRYGQRRREGGLVEHKQEAKVITAILEMRKQGLSLRQIAKNLSSLGLGTKAAGKKWHPEMIRRIIDAN